MTRAVVDDALLRQLVAEFPGRAEEIIRKAAFEIEGQAKIAAPVDTGALRNSLDAVQESRYAWRVQDGVEYGIYQELGTARVAAQPFLFPAFEAVTKDLMDNIREFFDNYRG